MTAQSMCNTFDSSNVVLFFYFSSTCRWFTLRVMSLFSFLHWQVKLNTTKRSFDTQKTDELTTFMRLASELKQANVQLYGIQIDHTKVIVLNRPHVLKEQTNESCLHLLTCLTFFFTTECKRRIVTTLFHTVNNEQGLCSHIFSYAMIRCVMLYWTSVIKNGIVLACHMFFSFVFNDFLSRSSTFHVSWRAS